MGAPNLTLGAINRCSMKHVAEFSEGSSTFQTVILVEKVAELICDIGPHLVQLVDEKLYNCMPYFSIYSV